MGANLTGFQDQNDDTDCLEDKQSLHQTRQNSARLAAPNRQVKTTKQRAPRRKFSLSDKRNFVEA